MSWLKNNKYKVLFSILLIFLISIPALLPLFQQGFFVTDDGEWMIIRFSAFYQAIADGQFPVRFLHRLNFDYGYPVATFLYPGFMYAAVPLHFLKIGFVDSVKTIFGLSLIGTTLFTYFWLLNIFKTRIAATAGAIVSLYLPYHLYDVYIRGSVGEVFALTWVAFVLWMIEKKNTFFISIGIAILLLSHNSLAALFLPFLFLYAWLKNISSFKQLGMSFLFGILLSAFFILPVAAELPLTSFSQTTVADPSEYFADISLIGFSTLLIFFFSLIILFSKRKLYRGNKLIISLFLFVTFLVIFFSSSFSTIFWQFIPSSFIQFPFRLLSYLVISIAFLTAFILSEVKGYINKTIVFLVLMILVMFSSISFISPNIYMDKGEGYYFTNEATTTVQDEYMPVWVKEKPLKRSEKKVEIIKGEGKVENIIYNNKQTSFTITAENTVRVKIHTIYWPGWRVFVDNNETGFSYDNPAGVLEFDVPGGNHHVRVEFGETSLRMVANGISVASLMLLFILSFKLNIKSKNAKAQVKDQK